MLAHRPKIGLWTVSAICLAFVLVAALQACDSAPKADPVLEAARHAYLNGYYMEAEMRYEEYLQSSPQGADRLEAWTRLLDLAVNVRSDLKKGVDLLEATLLEYGDDPDKALPLMTKLGDLYERTGNRDKAVELWQSSLGTGNLPPDVVVSIMLKMAKSYREQGYFDLAMDVYQDCARAAPDPGSKAQCLYELAQTYSFVQNFAQARATCEEVRRINGAPAEIQALATFLLAEISEYERKPSEARKLLESIQETYPNPKAVEIRLKNLD